LDPPQGIVIMMHKPLGVVCSHKGEGERVYDLLPERFTRRRPQISSIGRLDRDSSGLLLFTDDGQFLHRVISPRSHVPKRYRVRLERDLNGEEADLFAAGQLVLKGEDTPVGPAMLEVIDPRNARITIHEGRYHQVRRMFAAVGNHVQDLHREAIGGLMLDDLEPRAWRMLQASEMASIMAPNADTCDSSTETGSP
ncbi:16S rRNA pseudouridine(516) synthase, partial [Oleiagrimonas sp.]|uniref:16S rRNA pseudouridine(516) synthase n=1 Tax=Oleiagrimonas sp. TaxID=2010330 RepID=UPI002628FA22